MQAPKHKSCVVSAKRKRKQTPNPTQTVPVSPCLSYGQRLLAPCLHCQVSGAHKGSGKAQTLQDFTLQRCSWGDWTLYLITSHLSLYFQIIFFLKKKEKHYAVADDGKGGGTRKRFMIRFCGSKVLPKHLQC